MAIVFEKPKALTDAPFHYCPGCPHGIIHRLVAEAFIPNPHNLPCINHKDENPANPVVWNLEWCSYSYNNGYGARTEKHKIKIEKPIQQYTLDGQFVDRYNSVKIASKITGINYATITQAARGKYKQAGGYVWKYV